MKIKKVKNYYWVPGGGIVVPSIQFTAGTVLESASVGDDVGTATVPGTTGTPSYSLTDDAGGLFSINSSSGLVEVADALDYETATSHNITIAVSGVTPSVSNRTFAIAVTNVVEDSTPSAFSFVDITDAALSTVYTSNTITVAGMEPQASVAVTITGGEYSKNGGTYTSSAGTAAVGDQFAVRATSSGSNSTAVNVALTIGGVSDTYTVTTLAGGGGDAGSPIGLLLILTKAA
jgi:hypothetical protein